MKSVFLIVVFVLLAFQASAKILEASISPDGESVNIATANFRREITCCDTHGAHEIEEFVISGVSGCTSCTFDKVSETEGCVTHALVCTRPNAATNCVVDVKCTCEEDGDVFAQLHYF